MNDTNQPNDFTDREIRIRPLVIFLIATLVVTAGTLFFVYFLFNRYAAESDQSAITAAERMMELSRPTNAVVEGSGEAAIALAQYRAAMAEKLETFRWIDREAGVVQVPVALAMQKLVLAGLPVRKDVQSTAREGETMVEAGLRLFGELGCIACHQDVSGALGPTLKGGVIGREVVLVDGTTFIADEDYVRNSILYSMDQIIVGYAPVMPNFKDIVNDTQLDQLVAYIKSLAD
jgi:mono/diheme cytochrome c family protein